MLCKPSPFGTVKPRSCIGLACLVSSLYLTAVSHKTVYLLFFFFFFRPVILQLKSVLLLPLNNNMSELMSSSCPQCVSYSWNHFIIYYSKRLNKGKHFPKESIFEGSVSISSFCLWSSIIREPSIYRIQYVAHLKIF